MEESQSEDGRDHSDHDRSATRSWHCLRSPLSQDQETWNTEPAIVFLPWARRETRRGRLHRSVGIEWPSRYAVPPQRPTDRPKSSVHDSSSMSIVEVGCCTGPQTSYATIHMQDGRTVLNVVNTKATPPS